jgi:hypothetical protein
VMLLLIGAASTELWQARSGRGLARIDGLARRRCIANQFLLI